MFHEQSYPIVPWHLASYTLSFIFRNELLKSYAFLLTHEEDVLLPTIYYQHSLILTPPSVFITATYRGTDRLVVNTTILNANSEELLD
jgi:hypothetical protein